MSFLDDIKKLSGETKAKAAKKDQERRNLILSGMSRQCLEWSKSVRSDIEKDATGKGEWEGHSLGFLHYHFEKENGGLLKIEKFFDRIEPEDIINTHGYKELEHICNSLGVSITIKISDDLEESLARETTVVSYYIEVGNW